MKPETIRHLSAIHDLVTELLTAPDAEGADIRVSEMWNHLVMVKNHVAEAAIDAIGMNAEELELMRSGNIIQAIKDVRNRTGIGLKDAKELVERTGDKLGLRVPDPVWGRTWKHIK